MVIHVKPKARTRPPKKNTGVEPEHAWDAFLLKGGRRESLSVRYYYYSMKTLYGEKSRWREHVAARSSAVVVRWLAVVGVGGGWDVPLLVAGRAFLGVRSSSMALKSFLL